MTPREAESIGAAHGLTQRALLEHPESAGITLQGLSDQLAWDTGRSLEMIKRIERQAARAPEHRAVVEVLSFQRQLLESGAARSFSELSDLPCQLLHGDFHDQQVLLDDDASVVAVVDWELIRPAARVWELIRSLSFSHVLETDLLEHYVSGFRRHVALTEDECRGGIELWWQTRLHGTWVYEAYFLEQNDRTGPLFEETVAISGASRMNDGEPRSRIGSPPQASRPQRRSALQLWMAAGGRARAR